MFIHWVIYGVHRRRAPAGGSGGIERRQLDTVEPTFFLVFVPRRSDLLQRPEDIASCVCRTRALTKFWMGAFVRL